MHNLRLNVSLFTLAVIVGTAPVVAQPYPNKVIRILTAASGGTLDLGARIVAQGLSGPLGQQVIVDNRGVQAAEVVAKAPPDGYTLVYYTSPLWLAPFLRDKAAWDPVRDFAPVSLTDRAPTLLVVHPSLPVKSVKDVINLARSRPGELNYARSSAGSTAHLSAELFNAMARVNIVSIPYKGGGPSLVALVGGEVQTMFSPAGSVVPYVKAGRLKALAVSSSERFSLYPELPTVAATGLPGYESEAFVGVLAPAGTPAAIINRLNHEIVQSLKRPEIKERFTNVGVETVGSTPDQFAAVIKAEMVKWGKVIKDAGIRDE